MGTSTPHLVNSQSHYFRMLFPNFFPLLYKRMQTGYKPLFFFHFYYKFFKQIDSQIGLFCQFVIKKSLKQPLLFFTIHCSNWNHIFLNHQRVSPSLMGPCFMTLTSTFFVVLSTADSSDWGPRTSPIFGHAILTGGFKFSPSFFSGSENFL